MAAALKNFTIEQGTTYRLSICWRTSEEHGAVVRNLTGWKFRMQARRRQQDADILINATTENGKIIVGADPTVSGSEASPTPSNGWITVKLADTDTDALRARSLLYDLEAIAPNNEVYRLLKGQITIDPNITQTPSDPVVEG